jgi:DNA-binding transcriptional MerR regulator
LTPYLGTAGIFASVGSFTIGALARTAEVSVETVRYYERRGLLEQPERGDGYRQYSEGDVQRLAFIRRAKDLGFTLTEIRELLDAASCNSAAAILDAARVKLSRVEEAADRLATQRRRLQSLVRACEGGGSQCVDLEVAGG